MGRLDHCLYPAQQFALHKHREYLHSKTDCTHILYFLIQLHSYYLHLQCFLKKKNAEEAADIILVLSQVVC